MATQAELEAELVLLRAARIEHLTTGRVKEVSRDGRKIVRAWASLKEIDDAIAATEAALADVIAGTDNSSRFRALRPRFG